MSYDNYKKRLTDKFWKREMNWQLYKKLRWQKDRGLLAKNSVTVTQEC